MIRLLVAKGCAPTGRVLAELLRERGVRLAGEGARADAVVSYGVGYTGPLPALNRRAGARNKFEQGRELERQRVQVVPHLTLEQAKRSWNGPMLARKFEHMGGTDIMVCLEPADLDLRTRAGAQFFSKYIPSDAEFRVWTYRKLHLGTYQKVLRYPERYRKVGRNYANGFAFELVRSDDVPRPAVELAANAVAALDLDFGAVDMLRGRDGGFYVLEVNTAPGVEGDRRQAIVSLADRIQRWVAGGFKRRNGERRE